MTPPKPSEHGITWNVVGKATIAAMVAWAAYEFREMRTAVYNGQTKTAVLETRVDNVEGRVKRIEARIFKEQ